ncbi:hypothetical protein DB30_07680 [Enhygromyxa salina]|uniref:Uncharacterized protein n=2 Tax=Enhygromyxa salina TaxID=215803 RepID=A0A0C2DB14_9BACT|nr:hypothetical protein DB30_07680 [Enhygromyxa salina]
MSAFQHACRGEFRFVDQIPKLVDQEHEYIPYNTCADLLGDAGRSSLFEELVEYIARNHVNYELTYSWCHAVAIRGRLGDIPTLIDAYEANISDIDDDNDIILMFIAQVIDEAELSKFDDLDSFANVSEYRACALEHCKSLAERYGGEDILLWRGQPTSVRRMARMFIEPAGPLGMSLPSWTRHRFEASTGIDCTAMFDRRGVFKPLAAAAIAEAFLDSPAAAQYRDGVRYFFGHPVP